MAKRIFIFHILYLISISLIFIVCVIGLVNVLDISIELPEVPSIRTMTIPEATVKIPTKEDFDKLEELYKTALDKTRKLKAPIERITELNSEVLSKVVSSDANYCFNQLVEEYTAFNEEVDSIQEMIDEYKNEYNHYLKLSEEILKVYSAVVTKEFVSSMAEAKVKAQRISLPLSKRLEKLQDIEELYNTAKQFATMLYARDYEQMSIIAFYEGGNCSVEEICRICKVIENRIKDPGFWYAHTAEEVIWAEGQYEPTWTTPMNYSSPRVREIVDKYMRGLINVDMPDNVVFQAKFPQPGREIWNYFPESGHYYCTNKYVSD